MWKSFSVDEQSLDALGSCLELQDKGWMAKMRLGRRKCFLSAESIESIIRSHWKRCSHCCAGDRLQARTGLITTSMWSGLHRLIADPQYGGTKKYMEPKRWGLVKGDGSSVSDILLERNSYLTCGISWHKKTKLYNHALASCLSMWPSSEVGDFFIFRLNCHTVKQILTRA